MAKDTPSKAKGGVSKPKKEKKEKDPNAPKRPKSAYFFFMDDVRPQTKKDNPDLSVSELAKVMGAEWNKIKETSEADKYRELAVKDKERYEKAMAKYKPPAVAAAEEEEEAD